ncbi:MAG: uracil phosphoribosyltransferase [Promicromonosporaceae bacterium]|nr:uracil phosphoribosyltransferase [Promicromonosporaceae bacterium]
MRLHVADHPLVNHKLTMLRDKTTPSATFRLLVDELVTLLTYEATRDVRTVTCEIETPICKTVGTQIARPRPVVIPILRAGLGMLDGLMKLLPEAEIGFLGLMRDEDTLEAITYAERLPETLAGRQVFILDPMLATGGSLLAAIEYATARGASEITCICILATPEGLKLIKEATANRADVSVVVAAVDEGLNEHAYIVPGLGDAGDRLYGVVG